MFNNVLSDTMLRFFSSYIGLYLDALPDPMDLKNYIKLKCEEKGIVESYDSGLITQDEFCNFLLAHIYTKYIVNKNNIREVSDEKINEVRDEMKLVIFRKQ